MAEQQNIEQQTNSESGGSTAVATRPQTRPTPPRVDRLPPWRVLLHNDDHSAMDDVVMAIRRVTHLSLRDAFMRMMEAHSRGVTLLIETHREHAELVVEQLATFKLTATAEPSPCC